MAAHVHEDKKGRRWVVSPVEGVEAEDGLMTAVQQEDGTWSARIVDPRDGSVYRARMRLDAEHRLHLRGYIGIPLLGRTQVWTPFERPVPESCRLPAVL